MAFFRRTPVYTQSGIPIIGNPHKIAEIFLHQRIELEVGVDSRKRTIPTHMFEAENPDLTTLASHLANTKIKELASSKRKIPQDYLLGWVNCYGVLHDQGLRECNYTEQHLPIVERKLAASHPLRTGDNDLFIDETFKHIELVTEENPRLPEVRQKGSSANMLIYTPPVRRSLSEIEIRTQRYLDGFADCYASLYHQGELIRQERAQKPWWKKFF